MYENKKEKRREDHSSSSISFLVQGYKLAYTIPAKLNNVETNACLSARPHHDSV